MTNSVQHGNGFLTEIGGERLFGQSLKQDVEDIFARNQITPAVALDELRQLHKQLEEFQGALNDGTSAFSYLKVGDETLPPGECEVGVLIPRTSVNNRLLDLANEFKELGFILNTFAEVATGSKDKLTIRTLSSTELLVFLKAAAPYAACLAVAVERIVALYKQILEIRKLHHEIRNQGVPEAETSGIETYVNQRMEEGIQDLSVEIIDQFYKRKDVARKNELRNALRISLNKLANRIDRGFNLEVRVEPLEHDESQKKQDTQTMKSIELIQAATKNMQFLKLGGEPILKLPDNKREKGGTKRSKRGGATN